MTSRNISVSFKVIMLLIAFVINVSGQNCGLELIMIDACNTVPSEEGNNEFFIITTETDIVASDVSISVDCPDGNEIESANFGTTNTTNFVDDMNTAMEVDCGAGSGVFIDGTFITIPSGSLVIAFPCNNPTNDFPSFVDFNNYCGSPSIYVIFGDSDCGALFKNNGTCTACGCFRFIDVNIGSCTVELNYDITLIADEDAAYISPGIDPNSPEYNDSDGCVPIPSCPIITATFTGGETLCGDDCSVVEWEITGGSAPYDLDFNVSVGAFDLDFPLNNQAANGMFNVCLDNTLPVPFYDPGSNTLFINELFGNNVTLELTEVTDDAGCSISLTGQIAQFVVSDGPTINDISDISVCSNDNGMANIDLGLYENDVNGGSGDIVTWYDDATLMNEIGPVIAVSMNETIYAVVTDGDGCDSDDIEVDIIFTLSPIITPLMNAVVCDSYTLPPISGSNLTGNERYYTSPGGMGTAFDPGAVFDFDIVLYIYDENGACSDEEFFTITILDSPDLTNVQNVTSCGSYILPPIQGSGLIGNERYYAQPGGTGVSFLPGDIITTSMVLYIYSNNGNCSDEVFFFVTIEEGPSIDPIQNVVVCEQYELPAIIGTDLTGNEGYFTMSMGNGTEFNPGDLITSDITLYAYDGTGDCATEIEFTITITPPPNITMPPIISDCGSVELPTILGDNLTTNVAYFTASNGMGVQFNPGDIITSSQLLYIYDAAGNCTDEHTINVNVDPGPVLDPIADVTVCDYYILPEIFGQNLQNEHYIIDLTTDLNEGDTIFTNTQVTVKDTLDNNPTCFDEITFEIEIITSADAGDDILTNACTGSIVDLSNLLDPSVLQGGTYIDINNTGNLIDSILDLSLNPITEFNGLYILTNSCGMDSAQININIANSVNAGNDTVDFVCENTVLDLSNYIVTGDAGGVFIFVINNEEITQILTDSLVNYGSNVDVLYIVGDGQSCPQDTAIIELVLSDNADFDIGGNMYEQCGIFVLPEITGTNLSGQEIYDTEPDGSGTSLMEGDTIFNSSTIYLLDEESCNTVDSIIVVNLSADSIFINELICNDDTVNVNGELYYFGNSTGIQQLPGPGGCDTTLIVEVDFYVTDTNFINLNLCFGAEITINNVTYNQDKPMGQQNYPFADKNGCDSLIVISLTFDDAATTPITGNICSNDSVLVNNTYYSIDNPSGMDTIPLPSGCDSILDISFTFMPATYRTIDTVLCEGDFFVVNGTIYNADNDQGEEIFVGQNYVSCDSIVTIIVNPVEVEQGFLTGEFCTGEIIDTLGATFTADNPEMLVTLVGASAQNCDSTVLVSFDFIDTDEGLLEESICQGGSIEIMGTVYDENNTIGQFTTQTIQGCDSIVNVMISVEEVEAQIQTIDADCNEIVGFVVFDDFNITSSQYSYSLDNGVAEAIEPGDTIFNIAIGNHDIEFSSEDGCSTSLSFSIEEAQIVDLDLPEVATLKEGESYTIDLGDLPPGNILWSPDVDISCVMCANPVVTPTEDITYIVDYLSDQGCEAKDSISFRVIQTFNFYISNTFSPNNDGINDRFYLSAEEDVIYSMQIYNRWGNKMYDEISLTANNMNQGWDGTFNGSTLNPGVYVYYIEAIILDEVGGIISSEIRKFNGSITIFK